MSATCPKHCVFNLTGFSDDLKTLLYFENRWVSPEAKSQRFCEYSVKIEFCVYSFEKRVESFKKCALEIEKDRKDPLRSSGLL